MGNYHFHKECIHYENCKETKDRIWGHEVIRLWCPAISKMKHNHTDILRGRTFNCGDAYDKSGGQPHYPSDLHTVKVECNLFEPIQTSLFN